MSVWNAASGEGEISTKWLTGKRVVVAPENKDEAIAQIEAQDEEKWVSYGPFAPRRPERQVR